MAQQPPSADSLHWLPWGKFSAAAGEGGVRVGGQHWTSSPILSRPHVWNGMLLSTSGAMPGSTSQWVIDGWCFCIERAAGKLVCHCPCRWRWRRLSAVRQASACRSEARPLEVYTASDGEAETWPTHWPVPWRLTLPRHALAASMSASATMSSPRSLAYARALRPLLH